MKVLAIDTSNQVMGVGLIDGSNVLGEIITNTKNNHSVRLMPAIEQLLTMCDVKSTELEKIVVAAGPGSYTGIRIGVTVAKTLAWSLQIPLSGISSLAALAINGEHFNGYICPLFDARRQQVFTGLYRYENGLRVQEEDRIILLPDWLQIVKKYEQPVLFIGQDVAIHQATIQQELGDQAVYANATINHPRPALLAMMGADATEQDVHTFVPNYLRLAEAEAKWLANQKK
ncbi:tRNA (adenosine(37)-N6)-threonylcarbamoyltransferase complex dimerization subunit type 1 TsaB [Ectobacillus sp. sgz5001026]|uniref:tRNA (adenosine(37)-N6)-threonylcarbamoyltransferase complex dimerization subunit type 1 TsaB n=1 Tax=Ectobacillus sp. sgz5001026 TaxID=3242473 RepID=UPI0036D293CA